MIGQNYRAGVERRLNRHATTVLIGGIFLTVSLMMYLTFCNMPCEDPTYALDTQDLEHFRSKAYWKKHIFSPKRDQSAHLLILIMTAPKNVDRRDAIRKTWLNEKHDNVMYKFLIGSSSLKIDDRNGLDREQTIYDDFLFFSEVEDSYKSLTRKLMEGFKWAHNRLDFHYILKADDDSYVQVDKILEELKTKPRERFYWGFFAGGAKVKKKGKWAEDEWIMCDRYLPYARGGGYVLSSDLVHYVVSNAEYLQHFNSEDVSLGAWLGPLNIKRQHDYRFDTEFKSRGCNNKYLVTHKQSASDLRAKYDTLQKTGLLCVKELQILKSYDYKWEGLPSDCCHRNDSSIP